MIFQQIGKAGLSKYMPGKIRRKENNNRRKVK
jgi:hypothetical protein